MLRRELRASAGNGIFRDVSAETWGPTAGCLALNPTSPQVDFGAFDPVSRLSRATRRSQLFACATCAQPISSGGRAVSVAANRERAAGQRFADCALKVLIAAISVLMIRGARISFDGACHVTDHVEVSC
jgi:hypothetical protein